VYANKSPKEVMVSPFIILIPPYHTIAPSVREDTISAIGKKIEF
jgi:hypothetical protein